MSVQLRNALIGLCAAILVFFAANSLDFGNLSVFPAVGVGTFAWYILGNLSSNRKVNNLSDAERSKALTAPPPPGTGLVYVYREGFIGKALGIDVAVDNLIVAQLKSPRFTVIAVQPGHHTLAAGMKGFAGAQNKGGLTSFSINQGEIAVFGLKMQMGMIQGAVSITQEPNPRVALAKLSTITMVAPEPVIDAPAHV